MIEVEMENTIERWLKKFPAETPVVVVITHNRYENVVQCLEKLVCQDLPLVVIDDASTDGQVPPLLAELASQQGFLYLPKEISSGHAASVNQAFDLFSPHDVVVLRSDTMVPPGWLERLKAAAYLRTNVATATTLSNFGGLLSVPNRNNHDHLIANGLDTERADALIQQTSLHLTPIIPAAFPHCVYYKRSILEVVGGLDEALPLQATEIDFAQRAVAAGFCHVVADDLFIFHKGVDFKNPELFNALQTADVVLQARYPWYGLWSKEASEAARSSLAVALGAARAAFSGYRIAIDATILKVEPDGTQVWTLELIRALVKSPERRKYCQKLNLIIRDGVSRKALHLIDDLLDEVELIPYSQMCSLPKAYFDLLYRPLQIQTLDNLYDFKGAAARFVITQLDFISFSNPSYNYNYEVWNNYRYLTQLCFSQVDGIAFFSNDALQDSLLQGMQPEENRRCIIGAGVNHHFYQDQIPAPLSGRSFEGQPFILILGTNYKHKRRSYALQLFKKLVREYDWNGHMVLAGQNMPWGSSDEEDALERMQNPELRSRIHDLGAVSEAEKRWLLEKAGLVLYPSNYEGFGLVPFEAANAGTPCLATRSTSVQEVLGDELVYLENYNPESGAKIAWEILSNPAAAQAQIEAINERAKLYTWENTALKTWDFFNNLLKMPPRQLEVTVQPEIDRNLKAAYLNLQEQYERLEKWANELNQKVLGFEQNKTYKIVSRFNLGPFKNGG